MTTLTSTGAVNLTSSTNWSPAQIPATGDDLVIGAHTLTLDADMTLGSVTFNNASARLSVSGATRIVGATNGWIVGATLSTVFTSAIATGTTVELYGQWTQTGNFTVTQICNSTGGNLKLATIGSNQGNVLFSGTNRTSAVFQICTSWSGGTLTTVGRFDHAACSGGSIYATMSGGSWTHTNTGISYFGTGGCFAIISSGTVALSWTGDTVTYSTASSGFFYINTSANCSLSGTIKRVGAHSAGTTALGTIGPTVELRSSVTGTITIDGVICNSDTSRIASINCGGGSGSRINWRNQSRTIPSGDAVIILNGASTVADFTDLQITNAGRFVYLEFGAASTVVGTATAITNSTTSAQACVVSYAGALDGKVINLASDAPTLPTVSQVAGGTVYGYAASPLTGTGIVNDPADIAAAVGTALESISAAALRRFVTVNTGETAAVSGSVAALSGGGGGAGSGLTADQWTALRAILGVPASGTTPDDPTAGILDTIRDLASSTDGKLTAPRLAKIDNLLGSGTYSTLTAAQVEAALLNDADGQALLDAISSKVQALFDGGADVPVATLVSLIATQITTDHGSGSYVRNTEPDNSGIASAKTAAESADAKITAGRLTRIDALPTATAGTAGGLALHGATGGGAGDASQDTLLAVQETVDELAAALVGAESIALTGPVTGTDISIVIDSDYRQRSGTELPIPVDDSTGALSTRLNAIGLDNLSFGAAREGKAAGEITGTVYSVTNAAGVTTIRVEISNAGSGLSPGEYAWQLQASTTQGDEVDNEIVISGNLILERRTVAPL